MRIFVPFGWFYLYLLVSPVVAAESEYEVLQPVESRSNLVLESARGRALVERRGAAPQRLALKPDELLTTIAETRDGWTAAGVNEKKSSTQLIVINRSSQGTRRLAPPAPQRHPLQLRPSLAVRGERLEGMVWLEGRNLTSLSVRASMREGEDWSGVTIVAPPARGSQTGLVATVLADGRWLLAWSAFDGKDDEIVWSVGKDDQWSIAQRLGSNNSVPDISPAIVSTANGALLAWSRMVDGEYRLLMARFRNGSWSQPEIVGPRGSLDPGFAIADGRLHLLYRHAWPRAWAVSELSSQGRTLRFAVVPDATADRPILEGSAGESVELRWPGRQHRRTEWEAIP